MSGVAYQRDRQRARQRAYRALAHVYPDVFAALLTAEYVRVDGEVASGVSDRPSGNGNVSGTSDGTSRKERGATANRVGADGEAPDTPAPTDLRPGGVA